MNYTSLNNANTNATMLLTLDDQNKLLEKALNAVKVQSHHMRNCLDNNKLMDGLKHASNMLAELRTSNLTPKTYYQLYIAIFDSLRYLTAYFIEVHQSDRHHLADLYELVQYAGNIVPRLYLMITVGAAYMSMKDAPVREIMRDMMEMARGVQHPMRGLFLRHYLCGMTRDHLPVGAGIDTENSIHESIRFTLTNFMEMNKLWIRLQHQGHSRDREKRDIERRELRILVGTNLERLAQLDGVDLKLYRSGILPELLNEAVNCRDVLAQEYLMDILIQAFPDEFHLLTLEPFLSATAKLHPKVNIKQIIIALIDRLAAYATRESELELERRQQRQPEQAASSTDRHSPERKHTAEAKESSSMEIKSITDTTTSEKGVEEQCEETDVAHHNNVSDHDGHQSRNEQDDTEEISRGIPKNVELFTIFWERIQVLVKARPDLSIEDITDLLVSLIKLCLSCYPDRLEYVDQILIYCKDQCTEHTNSSYLHSKTTENHLMTLLSAPIQQYESTLTLLMLQNYGPLLQQQSYLMRRRLALSIVTNILAKSINIDTPEDVHNILDLCDVLLHDQKDAPAPSSIIVTHGGPGKRTRQQPSVFEVEDTVYEEQSAIAKLIQLFQSDDDDTQFLLLSATRRQLGDGGKRIRYTFPSLICAALKLSRRYEKQETKDDIWEKKTSTLYRFIHQVTTILYTQCNEAADNCLRFYVMAGQSASRCGFEELAYEFLIQAFTVYEESIPDSKAQYQAITCIIGGLQQIGDYMATDNYEALITKSALHGAKLLKKPDQCRAVYMASHLWWKKETDERHQAKDDQQQQSHDEKQNMDDEETRNGDDDDGGDAQQPANDDGNDEDTDQAKLKPHEDEIRHPDKLNGMTPSSTNRHTVSSRSNSKRTLECLQKSLKIADSCMDATTSLELFVEILNQCIYYYDNGNDAITSKYINGLTDMIQTHLSDLDETDLYPFTSSSSSLLHFETGSSMLEHVRRYFTATLQQLKLRKSLETEHGGNKYSDIIVDY